MSFIAPMLRYSSKHQKPKQQQSRQKDEFYLLLAMEYLVCLLSTVVWGLGGINVTININYVICVPNGHL